MSSNNYQQQGDIPDSYKPKPVDRPNFEAPSHHLSEHQREEVIKLAEQSHHAGSSGGHSTQVSSGTGDGFGYGSGLSSSNSPHNTTGGHSSTGLTGAVSSLTGGHSSGHSTGHSSGLSGQQSGLSGHSTGLTGHGGQSGGHGLGSGAGVLGGGTGSATQSHTGQSGQYAIGQDNIAHNRTGLTGSSSADNYSGIGDGTRDAAGRGVGSGINTGATAVGTGALGAAGAVIGSAGAGPGQYDNTSHSSGIPTGHSSSTTGHRTGGVAQEIREELGMGHRGAGHSSGVASGQSYGTSSGQQYGTPAGQSSTSGHHTGALATGAAVAGGAGVAAGHGQHGVSSSNTGYSTGGVTSGQGHSSTSSASKSSNPLQNEIEERARKAGTKATGFGTHGSH